MLGRPLLIACAWALLACGGRSAVVVPPPHDASAVAPPEQCNHLDDDGDGEVDEGFRDPLGNYLDNANCGGCGRACPDSLPNALGVDCELFVNVPTCAATQCASGFGRTSAGQCVALDDHLCLPCAADGDCGALGGARCVMIGGEGRCARPCGDGCPNGYVCQGGDHCEPSGSSCECDMNSGDFGLACVVNSANASCPGRAECRHGMQSACTPPAEVCDGADNDCDGVIDNGFIDANGAYSLSDDNCGACGRSCKADSAHGVRLTCGGDPFAPSCVIDCPDLADGLQIGDHVDADRNLADGCECVIASFDDAAGAPLDANCDGADGNVLASFYVTTEGDDNAPGSPTRPLRSIETAIERSFASLATPHPRPDVYIASGIYTESVRARDGVSLHGGYRSDFLAQNPSGFPVVIAAPASTSAFGGAALVVDRAGASATVIEDLELRGRDADAAGALAIGLQVIEPGGRLTLRSLQVRSGKPGAGQSGSRGVAGSGEQRAASDGAMPRGAIENDAHACIAEDANRTLGGNGGQNVCNGSDVSGGNGGSAVCPHFGTAEASGQAGRAHSAAIAGASGEGGNDLSAPITNDASCSANVCCGLADFTVPSEFMQATAGGQGGNGTSGSAGAACADPFGTIASGDRWQPGTANPGGDGDAGGGGGGGGAGAGVEITWFAGACEFADGLGGAGGGGGSGGCGGKGGGAGQSGGSAIGVLIQMRASTPLPLLMQLEITTQDGAPGGDGGAGGDGAEGGSGGFGGRVPDARRSVPTLAGPMQGERGGKGGDGGPGGGGGGGCGGSSVGIWVTNVESNDAILKSYHSANSFQLGVAGGRGRGGGGAVPAFDGAMGDVIDVLAR